MQKIRDKGVNNGKKERKFDENSEINNSQQDKGQSGTDKIFEPGTQIADTSPGSPHMQNGKFL